MLESSMNLTFKTHFQLHQHVYTSEKIIDVVQLELSQHTWLLSALKDLAKESQLRSFLVGKISNLQRGLPILTGLIAWKAIAKKGLDDLEANDLVRLFQHFENALIDTESLTATAKGHISACCRRLITDYIKRSPQVTSLNRVKVLFKTKLTGHYPNRGLISDISFNGEYPLGAIPHLDIAELKIKTLQRLKSDVDAISAACQKTLEKFEWSCQKLNERRTKAIQTKSEKIKRYEAAVTKKGGLRNLRSKTDQVDLDDMLTYYLQSTPVSLSDQEWKYKHAKELAKMLALEIGYSCLPFKYFIHLDSLATTRELLTCLLLLQIHTGWNVNSVLTLKESDIKVEQYLYKIQSLKPRTGDHTPVSFIELSDEWAMYAIELLRRRLTAMKRLGMVLESEDRLWVNPYLRTINSRRQYVGWGETLRRFIREYKLPTFSLEQVRNQILALTSQGKTGLQGAQQRAGHKSIDTTGHYIDSMLLTRLNSAVNVEFQRRLEASTIIDFRNSKKIDLNEPNALPIGDGTTCADPKRPPVAEYLENTICRALNCHTGDGCPNRRIVINEQRLEEIVRTTRFYKNNWPQLANLNLDTFREHHLPAMALNFGLQKILEKGSYRHMLKKMTRDLAL